MSYMRHDAVIATMSGDLDGHPDMGAFLLAMPDEYRVLVVGPFRGIVNNYVTWVFLPDGSNEGWEESTEADAWREAFIALWPPDRASLVHVRFGGDYAFDHGATVARKHAPRAEVRRERRGT